MGVSGCGKSTVGRALSLRHVWPFLEGDDYHPPANIAKMSAGTPLSDDDRAAWVRALVEAVDHTPEDTVILACSALTPFVQSALRGVAGRDTIFVLLEHTFDVIAQRMRSRDHFMPPALLQSQFDALTAPPDALRFGAGYRFNTLISMISTALNRDNAQTPSTPQSR